ncbi:butyrate kinase [Pseudodesulfovibrio sediminis]|uniref:Probable butyrate kinase n=1 Tax=Pseudodesulfovibrio sediminis TaxID=2810563 RepID=A0ABM7P7I9_9BACT|nr:butyrate kinase [Pseudodesulfovibrio sediminis]BCS88955.1 putative butyrate kinase [Pseudodesulfovibrio sediminis]
MIFVINPGSTSTKLTVMEKGKLHAAEEIQHAKSEVAQFERVADQFDFRMQAIGAFIEKASIDAGRLTAVAGRGGLLHPLEGGVYEVSDDMIADLQQARYGEHPCNLGAILARKLGLTWNIPAYVVDPAVTDEMMEKARLTGLPEIERRSLFHALNQRGVAHIIADKLDIAYESSNFIVCHLGGGISIGAHRKGRVVDVVNGLDGEGPFTPERSGGLPILSVLNRLARHEGSLDDIREGVLRQGGLFAHMGTNDPRQIVARMEAGDAQARLVFEAMAYNIAKNISALAPALVEEDGLSIDAIILTGGLARSVPLVTAVSHDVAHLGRVEVVPGEVEMASLAAGVERVLSGEASARQYYA